MQLHIIITWAFIKQYCQNLYPRTISRGYLWAGPGHRYIFKASKIIIMCNHGWESSPWICFQLRLYNDFTKNERLSIIFLCFILSLSYSLNYIPPKLIHWSPNPKVLQNVTVFWGRMFTGVIKFFNMTSVLIKRENLDRDMNIGRTKYERERRN